MSPSTSAVIILCLLVAGCGGSKQSDTDRAYMDVEFSAIDLGIAQEIVNGGEDGISDLPEMTERYIALTRQYADVLGEDEVKRRLADKASEVQDWCPPCAAALDRERETY